MRELFNKTLRISIIYYLCVRTRFFLVVCSTFNPYFPVIQPISRLTYSRRNSALASVVHYSSIPRISRRMARHSVSLSIWSPCYNLLWNAYEEQCILIKNYRISFDLVSHDLSHLIPIFAKNISPMDSRPKKNIRDYFRSNPLFLTPAYQSGYKWGVCGTDGSSAAKSLIIDIKKSI